MAYVNYDSSQFQCIVDPFGAAKIWVSIKEIDDTLSKLESGLAALESDAVTSASNAVDLIVKFTKPISDTERRHRASRALARIRTSLGRFSSPIENEARYEACCELMRLYGTFDGEKLRSDFSDLFDNEKPLNSQRAAVHGKIGGTCKQRNALLTKIADVFEGGVIPEKYLGNIAPEDPKLRNEFGFGIVNEYIGTWKHRARFFEPPVNISGYMISTFPDIEHRKALRDAYELLQLGNDKAMVCHTPRRADMGA